MVGWLYVGWIGIRRVGRCSGGWWRSAISIGDCLIGWGGVG
jgi:hypothetical protein